MNDILDELIEACKDFLDFTWTDEKREAKISEYCLSSVQFLNEIAGVEIDFNTDYIARDLLFNRVLYMDSHLLSDFEDNYTGMLTSLKIKYSTDENTDSI